MSTEAELRPAVKRRHFYLSKVAVARFVAGRTMKAACLWGLVFGLYVYASAIGFLNIAPNTVARAKIIGSLAQNAGLKALFGEPHAVYALGGFVDWRNISIIALVGAIWGLLTATRTFRGEEDSGRWELFLAGQTTARKATFNALVGLGASLGIMFLATTAVMLAVGRRSDIDFTFGHSLMLGATAVAGGGMFLAVGAFTSQLMPTRTSASSVAAAIMGGCFLLRAAADLAANVHWLIYVTPFGWIELVRPLGGDARALWLLPSAGLICSVSLLAAYVAGRRDLGGSIVADRTTSRAHTFLLHSAVGTAIRFSRSLIISWLLIILICAAFFGSLAKSAGQAFSSSDFVKKLGAELVHQTQVTGAKVYTGFIFFLLMTLIMLSVAAAVSRIREDEAEGYVDNLLVRRTGRATWLCGRIAIISCTTLSAALVATIALWIAAESQHAGLGFYDICQAGINAMAPAVLLLGVGVFIFGFLPRLTSVVLYGFIVWSFLLQLIGSILSLNHWLLDSSALYHITLAPSVNPDCRAVSIYVFLAVLLAAIGVWRFKYRDLASL